MILWAARNKRNYLMMFDTKPYQENGFWFCDGKEFSTDDELLPEVTFENSPQQIEIKTINKDIYESAHEDGRAICVGKAY